MSPPKISARSTQTVRNRTLLVYTVEVFFVSCPFVLLPYRKKRKFVSPCGSIDRKQPSLVDAVRDTVYNYVPVGKFTEVPFAK